MLSEISQTDKDNSAQSHLYVASTKVKLMQSNTATRGESGDVV